jgi:hypothetical protein
LRGIENLRVGNFFGKIFLIINMGPLEVERRDSSNYPQVLQHWVLSRFSPGASALWVLGQYFPQVLQHWVLGPVFLLATHNDGMLEKESGMRHTTTVNALK